MADYVFVLCAMRMLWIEKAAIAAIVKLLFAAIRFRSISIMAGP